MVVITFFTGNHNSTLTRIDVADDELELTVFERRNILWKTDFPIVYPVCRANSV